MASKSKPHHSSQILHTENKKGLRRRMKAPHIPESSPIQILMSKNGYVVAVYRGQSTINPSRLTCTIHGRISYQINAILGTPVSITRISLNSSCQVVIVLCAPYARLLGQCATRLFFFTHSLQPLVVAPHHQKIAIDDFVAHGSHTADAQFSALQTCVTTRTLIYTVRCPTE